MRMNLRAVILTLLAAVLLFVGFRPVFLMTENHAMESGAMDVSCVVHCVSAAVNEGVVLTAFVAMGVVLSVLIAYLVVRLIPTLSFAYAPERVFRDPERILTIIKRE